MDPAIGTSDALNKNKSPKGITVLRPVCTQSNSFEGIQHAKKECDWIDDLTPKKESSMDIHHSLVQVGASIIPFIKGKRGSIQKEIEDEMGVKIIFPALEHEDSIKIEGNSISGVTGATKKLQAIIDEVVKSPKLNYSHFVSLPLAIYPELVDKLINFQNSVLGNTSNPSQEILDSSSDAETSDNNQNHKKVETLNVKVDLRNIPLTSYPPKTLNPQDPSGPQDPSDLGIDRSIFIKPKTFHLTVLMLKLWNKERVDAAIAVLQSVSSKVMDALSGRPIFIKLKGLDCMQGSPSKARVLYAPVVESEDEKRLSQCCQIIIDAYVEAGLVLEKDAQRALKLHATLMNVSHRKRKKGGRRKMNWFDARGILNEFGMEEWGEYNIREAHLSKRFAYDENGYYHCCSSIPFS